MPKDFIKMSDKHVVMRTINTDYYNQVQFWVYRRPIKKHDGPIEVFAAKDVINKIHPYYGDLFMNIKESEKCLDHTKNIQ